MNKTRLYSTVVVCRSNLRLYLVSPKHELFFLLDSAGNDVEEKYFLYFVLQLT